MVFTPIISAFTAVTAAIIAICLKEFFDRRREIRNWFDKTYLEEGIDPLLWHLKTYEFYFQKLMTDLDVYELEDGTVLPYLDLEPLKMPPLSSIMKVESLLGTSIYSNLILILFENLLLFKSVKPEKRSKAAISDKCGATANAILSLVNIRDHLLTTRIRRKTDIYAICEKEEILTQLKSSAEAIKRWNERKQKRDELKSQING